MSANDGVPPLGGDDDRARAANPGSDPLLLARLAEERPELREVLAGNPTCPVYILEWLHSLRRPEIDRALETNRTAVIMGIVQPPAGAPFAPPTGAPMAPPAGGPVPLTAVVPVTPASTVTPVVPATAPHAPEAVVAAGAGATVPPAPPVVDEDDVEREPASRKRGMGLLIAIVPLLFLGGCLAAIALARGPSDKSSTAGKTTTTVRASVLPTQVTRASTPATGTGAVNGGATTGAATSAAATTDGATAAPPTDGATAAPPTDATEPATNPAARTTPRPAATTAAARSATTAKATTTVPRTTTLAGNPVQTLAWTLSQQLATALAGNDWAKARALSPSNGTTDAGYAAQYGNLDESTVVPVKTTVVSATTYSLRLGLVAHETNSGVKQTSLYCAHWNVDTAKGTITQVSGTKLRTESGTKAAATYTAEIQKACAAASLA